MSQSLLAADLSAVPAGAYSADPAHSYINFTYSHLGLSNPTLSFDDFTIDLNLDNADPTRSTVAVTIDTSSLLAGSDIWYEHLTSKDWMDVKANPEITFNSTSVEAAGDGAYKVMGEMMMHGETKPVTLNVTINAAMNHPMNGEPTIGLAATGEVLRSDFGLGKFAPNVSDEVQLNVSTELVKAD